MESNDRKAPDAFMKYVYVPSCKGGYRATDEGVHLGEDGIARYEVGDFKGRCLVYCHGNGEVATSSAGLFRELVRRGLSVVAPDYRGYGLSAGTFSEAGIYEAAHAAYDALVARGVEPRNIFVWGYSLGSGAALELASAVPCAGLILQTPFASGQHMLEHYRRQAGPLALLPWLPKRTDACPSLERAVRISVPALVFHGTADRVVPFEQGRLVFDALASRDKRLVEVPGGDHCDFQHVMGWDNYVDTLAQFARTI